MIRRRLRSGVRAVIGAADLAAGLLLIAITAVNLAAVFMRYVMLDSIPWSEEVMRYASIWLTFLGAAAASFRGEHLSLDLMRGFGGPLVRRVHDGLLHLIAAGFAAVVLWQGVVYCIRNGLQTAPTTGMPMLYAYGALAVGGGLLLLAELARLVDAVVPPSEDERVRDFRL